LAAKAAVPIETHLKKIGGYLFIVFFVLKKPLQKKFHAVFIKKCRKGK